MRLSELEPRWVHPNIFVFRCPCGCRGTPREVWMSCKDVVMPTEEQWELFRAHATEPGQVIIASKADCAWTISSRDFETMSCTPSLDFSKATHWHGHITDGAIK